ncbi:thiamine diphosphokinase [Corticicoccus populi]|uniref:Thiamine diphosphokinase n=1 Tax=Corticicoccus populi TaxID=1812821 RepID=A0ABW5WTQ4_9STAP
MHVNVLVRETNTVLPTDGGDWAGVDRGVYLLLKQSVHPVLTYGDFDSVSDEERDFIQSKLEITPVKPEKDETDLELALLDIKDKRYQSIDVYGATGGRIDHLFGNVQLLVRDELKHLNIRLIDGANIVEVIPEGRHTVYKHPGMKYVSFIPVYEGTELTLEGMKYPLSSQLLNIGSTLTISNEFDDSKGEVSVNQPIIMIQSKDSGRMME